MFLASQVPEATHRVKLSQYAGSVVLGAASWVPASVTQAHEDPDGVTESGACRRTPAYA